MHPLVPLPPTAIITQILVVYTNIRRSIATMLSWHRNRIWGLMAGLLTIVSAIVFGLLVDSLSNWSLSRVTCNNFGKFCPQATPSFLNMTFLYHAVGQALPPGSELAHRSIRYVDRPVLFLFDDDGSILLNKTRDVLGTHIPSDDDKYKVIIALSEASAQILLAGNLTGDMLDTGMNVMQNYTYRFAYLEAALDSLPADAPLQEREQIHVVAKVLVTELTGSELPSLARKTELSARAIGLQRRSFNGAGVYLQASQLFLKNKQNKTGLIQRISCLVYSKYCQHLDADVQAFGGIAGSVEDMSKRTGHVERGVRYVHEYGNFVRDIGTIYLMRVDTASPEEKDILFKHVVHYVMGLDDRLKQLNEQTKE